MPLLTNPKSNINPIIIRRLQTIFRSKNWYLPDEEEIQGLDEIEIEDIFPYHFVYNNFLKFLSCLDKNEQNLVLELSEDFLHCPTLKYRLLFRDSLLKIPTKLIQSASSIILIPLLSPEDFGKVKSSVEALYSFHHSILRKIAPFKNKSTFAYTSPLKLKEEHSNRNNSLIIYFDDFIGSGESALKALKFYDKNLKIDTDKIAIVSLVAQESGINDVEKAGYSCFTAITRKKCISDSAKFKNKFATIKTIRKIENRMKVKKDYRLGYKRTQALVSMIRTPNNTLPIYWIRRTPDGEKWDGIFTR